MNSLRLKCPKNPGFHKYHVGQAVTPRRQRYVFDMETYSIQDFQKPSNFSDFAFYFINLNDALIKTFALRRSPALGLSKILIK